jgi:hypothetical protein
MNPTIRLRTLAVLALSTIASPAAISVVNSDSLINSSGASTAYTLSFDPGASADAIVVAVIAETNASSGAVGVTFDGATLVPAFEFAGSNVGIYYLNNPTTGAASDLVVDFTTVTTMNGVGFAVTSLDTSDLIEATQVATTSGDPGALSVMIAVPSADSFVMAGFNTNGGAATASSDAPLTQLFGADLGSLGGTAGYENGVSAGDNTYTFTASGGPRFAAAVSFNVIPEPSALGLLGGMVIFGFLRRRK